MTRALWMGVLLLCLVACGSEPAQQRIAPAPKSTGAALAAAPAPAPSAPKVPVAAPSVPANPTLPADAPSDGEKHAKVTVVIFSDFQCPFCARALPTLKELQRLYGKELRLVFRHQPLPFHPNAALAAEAAMAANEQGRFWEMHDRLFAHQDALDRAGLERSAEALSLNLPKFKAALESGKFRPRVEEDLRAAEQAGIRGTPTFLINGRKLVGAQPVEAFRTVIDEELQRADRLLAQRVPRAELYARLVKDAPPSVDPPGAVHRCPTGDECGGAGAAQGRPAPADRVSPPELGRCPLRGPKDAPVTVVIFSDFQCPYCGKVVPTLKALEARYPGKLRFAFKNHPLPFHDLAKPAAEAALAAGDQGRFWEMHDLLFAHQDALDRSSLEIHAQELGLNLGAFRAALDSHRFQDALADDGKQAAQLGVEGTPTFFINGRRLIGAQPESEFRTIIDEELARVEK